MGYFEGLSRERRPIAGDQPAGLTNESMEVKDVVHVPGESHSFLASGILSSEIDTQGFDLECEA